MTVPLNLPCWGGERMFPLCYTCVMEGLYLGAVKYPVLCFPVVVLAEQFGCCYIELQAVNSRPE